MSLTGTRMRSGAFWAATLTGLLSAASQASSSQATEERFWVPRVPPQTAYTVTCQIDPEKSSLSGTETIRLNNDSPRPLCRLVLKWPIADHHPDRRHLEITVKDKPASIVDQSGPVVFDLPEPLPANAAVEIRVEFRLTGWPLLKPGGDEVISSVFLPCLWWSSRNAHLSEGLAIHSDYDVRLEVPPGYAVATSGRWDPQTGGYTAKNVRTFGIYLGKGHQVREAEAGDVLVRCVFRSAAAECAELLLATATDVINFYRERFGLYPYRVLNIVPGMDYPAGGYPVATSIVVIHGQQRFDERAEDWWRWIVAHEIGHQYWGEYVLEKDLPGWLWIGMGIYADQQYCRARGLKHRFGVQQYTDGVAQGLDTTVALTPEQLEKVSFDFNNVVIHAKGYAIISALACYLGPETFDRIYQRCLEEFGGRRLGERELQALCEQETGEELSWFFDQWVRSNRYLSYKIASHESAGEGDHFVTRVRVEKLGDLEMPVPVVARFEDGSERRQFTDRLLDVNVLTFESASPLKEVLLDPEQELAMSLLAPFAVARQLERQISQLPWTGAGEQVLDLFEQACKLEALGADLCGKLGLLLYDGKYYPKALEAFERTADLAGEGDLWGFTALVWQGHVLDLLGRRDEALERYRAALEGDTGATMRHDQYDLRINREWVEARLEKPFERE
jgi:tetratricopeptide (TPR) repeat protein